MNDWAKLCAGLIGSAVVATSLYAADARWNQRPDLLVAQGQLGALCDARLESINRRIGELEAKPTPTRRELSELEDLRQEYDKWRAICRGK